MNKNMSSGVISKSGHISENFSEEELAGYELKWIFHRAQTDKNARRFVCRLFGSSWEKLNKQYMTDENGNWWHKGVRALIHHDQVA